MTRGPSSLPMNCSRFGREPFIPFGTVMDKGCEDLIHIFRKQTLKLMIEIQNRDNQRSLISILREQLLRISTVYEGNS